jgi:hypothetical protein
MKKKLYVTLFLFVMAGLAEAGLIDAAGGTATLFGDTSIDTDHTGYTGSGFLGHNNNSSSGFTIASDCNFSSVTIRYSAYSTNEGEYYVSIEDTGSALNTSGTTTQFAKTDSWNDWETITLDLSGNSGDFLTFAWADTSNNGGVNVDYISFNAIPEPASIGLITLTIGSVFFIRRRLI